MRFFPSDSCGPGHIRKWWLTLRPEMGRKFPLVAGFLHCGSFSQVGWNDGVLVVSETQFFSAWTQDANGRPKNSVYPDWQDRSLLYMCVDIQYEWDGFASCRRPIHKWLLLSYGLVVMSRLVHVAGALMPSSCKWVEFADFMKATKSGWGPGTWFGWIFSGRKTTVSSCRCLGAIGRTTVNNCRSLLETSAVFPWFCHRFFHCEVKPSPEKHCSTITPFSDVAGGETCNFLPRKSLPLMFWSLWYCW